MIHIKKEGACTKANSLKLLRRFENLLGLLEFLEFFFFLLQLVFQALDFLFLFCDLLKDNLRRGFGNPAPICRSGRFFCHVSPLLSCRFCFCICCISRRSMSLILTYLICSSNPARAPMTIR